MKLMMTRLASVLRQERLRSGLRMRELSRVSNTPMQDLVDIEWQLRDDIDCLTLMRIARSLNLEISEFFDMMEA